MPGQVVHMKGGPHSARLLLWGRAADGWHGLITWSQRVRCDGIATELTFSAWTPSDLLSKPGWAGSFEPVQRIVLPPDSAAWPRPASEFGWHLGRWSGGKPPCPPGTELIEGPTWRNR